jgi:hypothetical protein
MSAAVVIANRNRTSPTLGELVDSITGTTRPYAGFPENRPYDLLEKASHVARLAFVHSDEAALIDVHDALRRLYDIELSPAHSPEAEHQFDPMLVAVRAELEQSWIAHELKDISPPSLRPGEVASVIRKTWSEHASFNHEIFGFMEHHASREQILLYFRCDYALNMRFYDLIALACVAVGEEAKTEVVANLWDEVGRGNPAKSHVRLYQAVLDYIGSTGQRDDHLALLGWEGIAGYNLLMHLALARRQRYRYIGALAITELSDPDQYGKLLRGCVRTGIGTDQPGVLDYYEDHVTIDALHGDGWIENVIEPAVRLRPAYAVEVMEGAIVRMNSTKRYWDWLLKQMKSM